MRCTKCQKNEAAIHFTPVVDGKPKKTVHLCKDCAPVRARSATLNPKRPCEFCGRPAKSEITVTGRAVDLCSDCGTQFSRTIVDLCIAERPHVMERVYVHKNRKAMVVPLSLHDAPEVRA